MSTTGRLEYSARRAAARADMNQPAVWASSNAPPSYAVQGRPPRSYAAEGAIGIAVTWFGCRSAASVICVSPRYEHPDVATWSSDQGWSTSQVTVSYPSSRSVDRTVYSPSDTPRPRVSWNATAYPASTKSGMAPRYGGSRSFPYGVRIRMVE